MTKRRSNNSGSYQQRGNRHIVQFMCDGKRLTKSFPSELEARTAMANLDKIKPKNFNKELTIAQLFYKWNIDRPENATNYGYKVRFTKHWGPLIGNLKPNELNVALLKLSIPIFKKSGLNNASVGLLFRILSSFCSELVENGLMEKNPVSLLSKKSKKDFIVEKDPTKIQFIRKIDDIGRVYTWLNGQNRSVSIAFAIGALAGLRINEIRGLAWDDVAFNDRVLHVRWQAGTTKDGVDRLKAPKNKTGRDVPMSDDLYSILQKHFERTLGIGWVIRPPHSVDTSKKFIGKDALRLTLRECLKVLKLPKLTWYAATRHTYGSQYIMNGGSLNKLKEILGHASTSTTEKYYVHLVGGQYSEKDRNVIKVDLKEPEKVVDWKLLDINSKLRHPITPSDHHWNERDSRPNGT